MQHASSKVCSSKLGIKIAYPQKPLSLSSLSCLHLGIQELVVGDELHVEIRKGNLKFLALILRNTHSCSLVLFHHSCLAGAARGSPWPHAPLLPDPFLPANLW